MLRSGRRTWVGYEGVAIVAFVLVALTVVKPIEIGVAIAGTVLLIATRALGPWAADVAERTRTMALGAAVVLLAVGLVWGLDDPPIAYIAAILLPLALVVGFLSMRGKLEQQGPRLLATGLLVIMVLTVGFIRIVALDPPVIDVLELHEAAADALLDGKNPYTEAIVVDTSPTADEEGALWVGYPYPPLTLIAYTGSAILLGDPRWASVLAVAIAIILIARPWARLTRVHAAALVALGLALVVQPVLVHVIRSAWTEPLALPFLAGAALLWRKKPLLAAVLLGLAFGTKQYFILALPLLLVWGDDDRWSRLGIAGGVAAISVLPAFLLDPGGAWDALVGVHLDRPLRLDSIGFAGIGWDVPLWLAVAASVVVAVWMAWSAGPATRFMLGLATTLAAAFLLTSQSFLNYWFFVGAATIIAMAFDEAAGSPAGDETAGEPARGVAAEP